MTRPHTNRIMTIRILRSALLTGLLAAGTFAPAPGAEPASAGAPWPADQAWAWYRRQPWIVGFNYVPGTAANTTEFWAAGTFDPATIDRELGWAAGLGFNSCRVFVQFLVWKHDPAGLLDRLDRFLGIAAGHGLTTTLVLFDDCAFGDPPQTEPFLGKQRDPLPGMILPSWTPSPGLKAVTDRGAWPDLERYIKDVVSRFANDPRVLMWDLYNEPGNSGMGNQSLPLVEATFAWARAASPAQPVTIAAWGAPAEITARQVELSDVISFHYYGNAEGLRAQLAAHAMHGRPVINTEWMARLAGSRWDADLPVFKEQGVGCYCWGLVNGRTQAQFPWNSPKGAPEPASWFHDLLRADGSPRYADEVAFLRRFTNAPGVPRLQPLFDFPVRDTSVCVGPDRTCYLTGTTGHPAWWNTNEGIRLWKSADLRHWEPLGLVWSFAKDATWQVKRGDKQAIWAPEIHFFNDTFWIAYCVNYGGTGVLRSTTGRPEGPYQDIRKDGPLTGDIDASLFRDDDGQVYFVYQNGRIAPLTDDLTGLAGEPVLLQPHGAPQVGFEGAFVFKANGRYHLSCADFADGRYHCYVASADRLMGPYGPRRLAIPHGGHNMFFRAPDGAWWSTFFGNDGDAPFRERPALLPVEFGRDGTPRPALRPPAAAP